MNEANNKSIEISNNDEENLKSESYSENSRLKQKGLKMDEDVEID